MKIFVEPSEVIRIHEKPFYLVRYVIEIRQMLHGSFEANTVDIQLML